MTLLTADIDSEVEKKSKTSTKDGKPTDTEIAKIRQFVTDIRQSRTEWEVDCFVNEMMKKGRHYVNDKGQMDARDQHKLRRTVNKFRSMLRRMKNAVTFNDPVVDVLPEVGQEENANQEELELASWFCLREHKQNDFQSIIKQVVETAALKSWALVSVTPNDGEDNKERATICQTYDSLDVFFDSPDMDKAHRLVISSLEERIYLESIGYDIKSVADATGASHSYSKTRLNEIGGKRNYTDKVLVDQVFTVEYERDAAGKIKPETKHVVHYVLADRIPITEKKVLKGYKKLSELFYVMYLEEDLFDAYNPPWMSDVVPLQRSLNDASENIDTILDSAAKVRWKQRQGDSDNIDVLQNKHMQLFRYDGAPPELMDFQNPPESLFKMMGIRSAQIEEQVGQMAPRMSGEGAAKSGRHQALVMAENQDNVKEPSDNLQKMLSWAFERVLDIAAGNIDKVMRVYAPEGENIQRAAIGEQYLEGLDEETKAKYGTIYTLRAFKNVRVTIIPGSFFTLAQAKSDMMEMLPITSNLGMKTEGRAMWKVMMRVMNVGLSRGIARLMDAENKKIEVQNSDWVIAEQEFLKMSEGQPVTATPEQDHEVHLRVKVPGLQAIEQKFGQDNDAYWMILQNVVQHQELMEMKKGNSPEASAAVNQAASEQIEPGNPQPIDAGPPQEAPAPVGELPMPG